MVSGECFSEPCSCTYQMGKLNTPENSEKVFSEQDDSMLLCRIFIHVSLKHLDGILSKRGKEGRGEKLAQASLLEGRSRKGILLNKIRRIQNYFWNFPFPIERKQ